MTQPWTQLSEAAALLASCAASPPKRVQNVTRYAITVDERWYYDGKDARVRALQDIADRFFDEVIQPLHSAWCAGTGDLTRDEILDLFPSVDDAIEQAISEPRSVDKERRAA